MTISVNQQVDFLWKKIGFGVAKTEVPSIKDATNESVISYPFIPGHKIWAEAHLIPAVIPVANTPIVQVHSQSINSPVECTMDITATTNRTWFTGFQDWIPIAFGSTYQVKVFLAAAGSSTPETTGVQLYAAGTNNNDEWFFDYEAGVLHFIGDNLPVQAWSGKKIFVCGARYVGIKGLNVSTGTTIGNISINGDTISSSNDIILAPFTGNINLSGSSLQNAAYPALPTDVATSQYVIDTIQALHPNSIWQGDSILNISDPDGNAAVLTLSIDGTLLWTATSSGTTIGEVTINGNTISGANDIYITPAADKVVVADSTTALGMPTGTTLERPIAPNPGYTRYNTTVGSLEWFNGTDWAGPSSQISSQIIYGDGNEDSFVLDQATHENNVIVTIHGVTQVPGSQASGGSYTISGSIITFAEVPQLNEKIEIRFISQSVTPILPVGQITESSYVDPAAITVGTNNVLLDSFSVNAYRAAKYVLSIVANDGNASMAEILMTHNGTDAVYTVTSTPMTAGGTTSLTYVAQVSLGSCELIAISTTSNTLVKLQKTYFVL